MRQSRKAADEEQDEHNEEQDEHNEEQDEHNEEQDDSDAAVIDGWEFRPYT
ncbi:hypothetical protein HBH98_172340 [Parastagonospora nodorum]|nr:hypothetical protein HBH43_153900 [Parastagonospora nodorum]KAH4294024.1 hypothetical protein HBI01_169980 [Parastagonospora nodorum]KAH4296712.1 hypothetical protein HBI02_168810 [Parastagonospora nodorum]KAH4325097.1 hypothetical protein HBI00_160600 [Parastagonospora nodorum]KAH4341979.1 hypothetical protein HBH98_172340 [Parastagonospora nodorum]